MKVAKGKASTRKDKLEVSKPVEERKVGKRKAAVKADKSHLKWAKKTKLDKKDPNKPKRPATAFFVFLEEFRKTYKEEHPNEKAVSVVSSFLILCVGKAGGGKWKSMSAADKSPYEVKAAQKKSDYEKLMIAYNKKQESVNDDEDEQSKSALNDEDDGESGEEEDDDEDEDDD
ncbi:HMG1/2-like protein isoform X1 [Carya illinoinensis]|uniref:HMG1/2-like protein isoform X1 n=1 Tax=Carya illinoinensis TaxID=32201 RepID=UPI001C71D50B|nr:HMG1/2-like protein isoform X1 [Carya illinoinensis]XP_042968804.1 HMG1/2-like protein isoform X1 [Carya illinoinensis]